MTAARRSCEVVPNVLSGEQNPGPALDGTPHNSWSRSRLLLVAAVCVIPVIYLAYVWHYGVNSFWEDDWSQVPLLDAARHGSLTLGLLWSQHNENRIFLPNLLWVLFDRLTHANAKSIMLFDAFLFVASYAFLLVIFRRVADRWLDPLQTIVVGLVWFSLADWQNALWSFQIAWYLILFFLMAMLLVLARREITPAALTLAMVLAAAASAPRCRDCSPGRSVCSVSCGVSTSDPGGTSTPLRGSLSV